MSINQRLKELGIVLPVPSTPAANYMPTRLQTNGILYVSGQLPFVDGKISATGLLGSSISIEDAYQAARMCGLNMLAHVNAALDGDLERVIACLKLTIFVAATPEFSEHPKVGNGISDLMVEVLGEAGRHARSAVGVASLPLHVPVEVEGIFEVKL